MISLNYSWETRRYPRPKKSELKKLSARAAELAGLPVDMDWELNIRFVGDREMARANEEFVGHIGTTDVITFSYFDDIENLFPGETAVELIICMDAAKREGDSREDSNYSREMVLYIVHGLLHSAGEDDLSPAPRRRMRRREKEVLDGLLPEFDFQEIFPQPTEKDSVLNNN